jgi:hypothetical protein
LRKGNSQLAPLQLSNREMIGKEERRYASVPELGDHVVVCFTARNGSSQSPPQRVTEEFSIEVNRKTWANGDTGLSAAFVPVSDPVVTDASDAPCSGASTSQRTKPASPPSPRTSN